MAALRGADRLDPGVTLDAALLALSGRVRLREGTSRSAEDVVTELWQRHFAPAEPDAEGGEPDGRSGDGSGKV